MPRVQACGLLWKAGMCKLMPPLFETVQSSWLDPNLCCAALLTLCAYHSEAVRDINIMDELSIFWISIIDAIYLWMNYLYLSSCFKHHRCWWNQPRHHSWRPKHNAKKSLKDTNMWPPGVEKRPLVNQHTPELPERMGCLLSYTLAKAFCFTDTSSEMVFCWPQNLHTFTIFCGV